MFRFDQNAPKYVPPQEKGITVRRAELMAERSLKDPSSRLLKHPKDEVSDHTVIVLIW